MEAIAEKKLEVKTIGELKGHTGCIYAVDQGLYPNTVFTGGSDNFIAQWNLDTLQAEKFATSFVAHLYSICHIPEKNLLLAGTTEGNIHIIDTDQKKEVRILKYHKGPVFNIKYSLETNRFYTAGGDGNFGVCSLDSLSPIKIMKLCGEKVRGIDFNYHTSEIAIATGSCDIYILDLFSLHLKHGFIAHRLSANTVRYTPDGKFLLSGGRDAYLNIWETANYTIVKSIPAHNWAIYDIAFSPDGALFATASRDKTVKIWNTETFGLIKRVTKESFAGHTHSVNKLLWTAFNNYLVSVGDDKEVTVRAVVYE
ncbi:MAG TPA: hypothetical protein VHB54_08740 [Mucilaginibacter sp.]|nr:hypothetical protein [Mucilaginibacter sp.]